jgi:hypothetical protein
MTIDSTDGITIGDNDFFKQDKTFSFGGGVLSGDSDTVLITTTNFNVNTDNQNIVIGTGSALMTVGKLSDAEQGIKIDSSGITNQNYWKLGQGDVQFKVGDGTNFLSFNENAGTFEIETQAFRLDTTASGGGIDIDSTNQTIKLEDASRVRTQVDINNGDVTLTEVVEYNNSESNNLTIASGEPEELSAFQMTKGDSAIIEVVAELDQLHPGASNAYLQVEIYGGTTSGSQTNLIANFLGDVVTSGNSTNIKFSFHSYLYDWIKIKLTTNADIIGADTEFLTTQNVTVKSYNSQTRVSLDGVFVKNNNVQYAKLTRSENELGGITKLTNIPTEKPTTTGIIYKDSNGFLKIS